MPRTLTIASISLFAALTLLAQSPQAERKPLSPPATAEASIDGRRITVNYSAPSIRGRKIMGGLVPFDQIWRTGANAATTLTTQADLRIGDLNVPRGTYTLYTLPRENGWTLIVNRQTGQWGTQYDASQDLGRVEMKVRQIPTPLETFEIAIVPGSNKKGVLKLTWETTEASVPIAID